jgi:hypothetical protein
LTSLHFGFEDFAYPDGKTTIQISEVLEAKYHIVEHFFSHYDQEIADIVTEAIHSEEHDLSEVVELFHQFLESREIERLGIPGVPTKAAKKGIKIKAGHRRAGITSRPSFVELGLYKDSFRVWLEP